MRADLRTLLLALFAFGSCTVSTSFGFSALGGGHTIGHSFGDGFDASALHHREEIISDPFFGLHVQRAIRDRHTSQVSRWPDIHFGSWRLWDTGVSWYLTEPTMGGWEFSQLDECVELARRNGVSVLLPLGLSPKWAASRPEETSAYSPGVASEPRNLSDWDEYVQTLATRYRQRIHAYEIWNEPNLKPFFSGEPVAIVNLARSAYRILKSVDSTLIVVSPAPTGGEAGVAWLDRYLSLGGGAYCDVIGFHLYTGGRPPESMVAVCDSISRVLAKHGLADKPVWNTETGWEIPDVPVGTRMSVRDSLRQATLAAYLSRALILAWWGGMDRFYWYAWDNYKFGLVDADGVTEKPAALAYRITRDWLIGRRMVSCAEDSSGVWTVKLVSKTGASSWIRWSVRGNRVHRLSPLEANLVLSDLLGRTTRLTSLAGGEGVTIGESPVLFSEANTR